MEVLKKRLEIEKQKSGESQTEVGPSTDGVRTGCSIWFSSCQWWPRKAIAEVDEIVQDFYKYIQIYSYVMRKPVAVKPVAMHDS